MPDRWWPSVRRRLAARAVPSSGWTTWEGNLPANRLYPSLGYRYAGTAEFFFMGFVRENLNCYEKAL